jgi:hypothetical protein
MHNRNTPALSGSTKDQQQTARAGATADRAKVATDLKLLVTQASADYKARTEALNAEYKTKAQNEYDAIKKNLPGAPAKKKGRKKKKDNKFFPGLTPLERRQPKWELPRL